MTSGEKEEQKWLIVQKWFHLPKVTGHINSGKPGFGRKWFIHSVNEHWLGGSTHPAGRGTGRQKWLLSPQSSQSSQRERPLNRGRQCTCDTHHTARRRMLRNPDERGSWPGTGQGRQEGAIHSTFFKIKVSHKVRWGMAWGSACPRKKHLLELELEIRMSVCSVENSDNHKSKAENRTEDASPSPAVQIPCASRVAQWIHTTRLLSKRTSYHPELWSQLLPASMRRASHFLST